MDNLVVKQVNFNGDELLAVKEYDSEKIYVGISWVCNGIGFNRVQKDSQIDKVQTDVVLKEGCRKFPVGVFDPNNETLAIELEYLPLWLAKISITPTMQRNSPLVVEKLIKYQKKVKNVLAQAFILNQFNLPKTYKEAVYQLLESIEENERLEQKVEELQPGADAYNLIANSDGTLSLNEFAKSMNWGRNRLTRLLCDQKVFMKGCALPYQQHITNGHFKVKESTKRNGEVYAYSLVTSKGIDYIVKKVQECGIAGELLREGRKELASA